MIALSRRELSNWASRSISRAIGTIPAPALLHELVRGPWGQFCGSSKGESIRNKIAVSTSPPSFVGLSVDKSEREKLQGVSHRGAPMLLWVLLQDPTSFSNWEKPLLFPVGGGKREQFWNMPEWSLLKKFPLQGRLVNQSLGFWGMGSYIPEVCWAHLLNCGYSETLKGIDRECLWVFEFPASSLRCSGWQRRVRGETLCRNKSQNPQAPAAGMSLTVRRWEWCQPGVDSSQGAWSLLWHPFSCCSLVSCLEHLSSWLSRTHEEMLKRPNRLLKKTEKSIQRIELA